MPSIVTRCENPPAGAASSSGVRQPCRWVSMTGASARSIMPRGYRHSVTRRSAGGGDPAAHRDPGGENDQRGGQGDRSLTRDEREGERRQCEERERGELQIAAARRARDGPEGRGEQRRE